MKSVNINININTLISATVLETLRYYNIKNYTGEDISKIIDNISKVEGLNNAINTSIETK